MNLQWQLSRELPGRQPQGCITGPRRSEAPASLTEQPWLSLALQSTDGHHRTIQALTVEAHRVSPLITVYTSAGSAPLEKPD